MKIKKVNKLLNYFAFRYFLIIFLCFSTMYITGRIADMDVLLGWRTYATGGISTEVALNIFSHIGGWGNRYLIVIFIGLFFSLICYLLLKKNIDKHNSNLWKTILLIPGILIYSNAPTKETLFLYPAIIFTILECNYITGRKLINLPNFFFKFLILISMFVVRGDLALPYFLLSIISILFKVIKVGKTNKKLSINTITFQAFLLSALINFLIFVNFPELIQRLTVYIEEALAMSKNIYRPDQFLDLFDNPFYLLYSQYLSLFPTIDELLQKPYLLLIVIDSIMIIYCFIKSWTKLFDQVSSYKKLTKIILIFYTYVAIVYFSFYGIIGSVNLGASQRFRVNYIPLGIMFPLILEKKLRDKETTFFLNN